jgi:protoporphyrinogen oxidase
MSAAERKSVAIVGGGLLGLTAAYRLAGEGVAVTVYERDRALGGLAGQTDLGGIPVDRYYHVVLPTDDRVIGLAEELGIGDRMRFAHTGVGFWHAGELTSMSSLRELLTFPSLRPIDRLRLGAFVARCQMISEHDRLDEQPLEDWLRSMCGDQLWERLWKPLLDSKFDGRFDDLPATYLWARTRRMSKTRDRSSREVMGTIDGGYQVLVDRLAAAIVARGGEILTGHAVRTIASAGGHAIGVVTDDGFRAFDEVLCTLLPAQRSALLTDDLAAAVGPDDMRYLGVVCLLLRLRRSLSPYYALNITDRRVPLTTVVETTHVVDPERVGGTLVYVPKYVNPDSPELERTNREVRATYFDHLRRIFPDVVEDDVLAWQVARARTAEPVHALGTAGSVPPMLPAPGLAVASTAHIYPELVNGQAVVGVADRVVAALAERLETAHEERRAA